MLVSKPYYEGVEMYCKFFLLGVSNNRRVWLVKCRTWQNSYIANDDENAHLMFETALLHSAMYVFDNFMDHHTLPIQRI